MASVRAENLAEIRELSVTFTGERPIHAVNGLSLDLAAGEVLAVLATFTQEWGRFCDSLDKVGRAVDAVERAYGDLAGTRRRALERPLDRIEELRRRRPPDPAPALRVVHDER